MLLPIAGLIAAPATHAAEVEIRVSSMVSATADFRPGETGKPAILLIHGFLQTREFAIIKSLTDALADAGYTVLSPTLSLNITYRKRSLSCDALHLHDMAGDLNEIELWIHWLKSRGYQQITGIGHSFGVTQLLAWAEKHPDRDFNIIGISPMGSTPFTSASQPDAKALSKPGAELLHAPLSYCEAYTAPVAKYISYQKWNEKKVLAAVRGAKCRTDLILGTEDKYRPHGWEQKLAGAGAEIHLIKGGNHFMDGTHEFDMLDTTLDILKHTRP